MATKKTISPEDKLVSAALAAIEKHGWTSLSLVALARKAKIPAATLYELCPDKRSLIALIAKRIDIAAIERSAELDETIPPRDRAFDAIIGCFESMAPMKPALAVIHEESAGDVGAIFDALPATIRSANWIADAAGLPTTGWQGFLVTRGIGVILVETLGLWLEDGDDLAKTMAHVDRRLRLIEEWIERLNRKEIAEEEDEEPAAAD